MQSLEPSCSSFPVTPTTATATAAAGAAAPPRPTLSPPEEEGAGVQGQHGEAQRGQLTPTSQLCAADVEWMASLMHTLSSSLQGRNLEEWLPGSS